MLKWRNIWPVIVLASALAGCEKDPPLHPDEVSPVFIIPPGFPDLDFPEDNTFTRGRFEMGRRLFYDPVLSRDSSISCASCHKAHLAFSDNVAFSPGVDQAPGTRNAPTLANVAYLPYFTREGGVPTLEMHVLVPLQEQNEFDFNIVDAAKRLAAIPSYVQMSRTAYGRDPDYFVITRALACFQRALLSGNSPYDLYVYQQQENALDAVEIAGMKLFFSQRTGCTGCHSGFNFTNNSFQNTGLYDDYPDIGRKRLTGQQNDLALFKVPTLRNAGLTAPYMHDGSMASLEEVVEHYNSGGYAHPNKSPLVKPLGLTPGEKAAVVAFLNALTDAQFVNNQNFIKQ